MGSLNEHRHRFGKLHHHIDMLEVAREKADEQDYGSAIGAYLSHLMNTTSEEREELAAEFQHLLVRCYAHIQPFYFEGLFSLVRSVYPNHEFVFSFWSEHFLYTGQYFKAVSLMRRHLRRVPATKINESCQLKSKLQDVSECSFDAWHLYMVNDEKRNGAFKKAIEEAIKSMPNESRAVLDVGCGSGLLSAYASRGGAESVIAIEDNETMHSIAKEVFAKNGCENVTLKKGHSSVIKLEDGEKCDILVTETLDCAAFGEGIITTVLDAHRRLLKPNAIIIPNQIDLYIAAVNCPNFLNYHSYKAADSYILSNYANCRPGQSSTDPYWCCYLNEQNSDCEFFSDVIPAFSVDLTDCNELEKISSGTTERNLKLEITKDGEICAIVAWWRANLFGEIEIETAPSNKTCWEQAVFPFANAVRVTAGEVLNVTMHMRENAIRFVTDADTKQNDRFATYTVKEEGLVVQMNSTDIAKCVESGMADLPKESRILDMTNLPSIGRMLQDRFENVCCNAIGEDSAQVGKRLRLKYDEDVAKDGIDCIVHWPISAASTINPSSLKMLADLVKTCPEATIVPQQVNIVGYLIESDNLYRKTHLVPTAQHGVDISALSAFNLFHYEDIPAKRLNCKRLSQPTIIRSLNFGEDMGENQELKIRATALGEATGILYYTTSGDYSSAEQLNCSMVIFQKPIDVADGTEITVGSCFIDNKLIFSQIV